MEACSVNKFYSKKRYGNDRGLSCCFRQWRSTHSHCSLLHGYSIGVEIIFECDSLDERNWVHDFGGLKEFKKWLDHMFDHTLLIAEDDPKKEELLKLGELGVADVRVVPAVGCERFAELALMKMQLLLETYKDAGTLLNPTVRVKSVEVFEHDSNSAIVEASPDLKLTSSDVAAINSVYCQAAGNSLESINPGILKLITKRIKQDS